MCEVLEIFDLAGEFKDSLSAEVIDVQGFIERGVKIDACRAIDHDVDILN